MPTSMVVGMLISVSTSQRMFSRSISRCSSQGSTITFSASVSSAEKYRCGRPMAYATMKVLTASTRPCSANRWISDRMRRCDSMANAISSSSAAIRVDELMGERQAHAGLTSSRKCVSMPEHREQESHAEKFRHAEDAHLGRHRFQHREAARRPAPA